MMKCFICGKEFSVKGFGKHIKKTHNTTSEKYYVLYLKKEGEGQCKECNKETKFLDPSRGYQKYCSLKCSTNNPETKQKSCDSLRFSNISNPFCFDAML
jgi:hypothetical protein